MLWLNSVATRTPNLSSGRDLRRDRAQAARVRRAGRVNVENDLWVFTPLVLPLPHSRCVRARSTARILRAHDAASCAARLGIDRLPALDVPAERRATTSARLGEALLGLLLRRRVVAVHVPRRASARRRPSARCSSEVDCVFAINDALADAKRAVQPGDARRAARRRPRALRARARSPDTAVPADLARLPRPLLGFYGTLARLGRLRAARRRSRALRPDWTHRADRPALIGHRRRSTGCRTSTCSGRRRYEELPAYCKGFDVGAHPLSRSRSAAVPQPDQAARVPVGRPAGRVDAGARGRARTPTRCARVAARRRDRRAPWSARSPTDSPERARASARSRCADETWAARVGRRGPHGRRARVQRASAWRPDGRTASLPRRHGRRRQHLRVPRRRGPGAARRRAGRRHRPRPARAPRRPRQSGARARSRRSRRWSRPART